MLVAWRKGSLGYVCFCVCRIAQFLMRQILTDAMGFDGENIEGWITD